MGTPAPAGLTSRTAPLPSLPFLLGVAVVAAGTLVAVLLAGGGAPRPVPPGLPDAGALTGWALPFARLLADAGAVVAAGVSLAAAMLVPSGERRLLTAVGTRLVRVAAVAAVVCALAAGAEIVLTFSDFLGIPVRTAVATPGLSSFVADTTQGRSLLAQVLLLCVVVLAAASVRTTRGAGGLAVVAFTGVAVPALAGHSAASPDHMLAVSSLMVHVLGAAGWVGGLAGVALVALHREGPLRETATRYSAFALWCVVAVAASGVVNAWLRLGSVGAVVGSTYGLLVLGKLLALALLVGVGWLHRSRTLPALGRARRPFVRLAAVELAVMAGTFGLAVGLSRSPTPVPVDGTVEATSAAVSLLGYPVPHPPTALRLLFDAYLNGFWFTSSCSARPVTRSGCARSRGAAIAGRPGVSSGGTRVSPCCCW